MSLDFILELTTKEAIIPPEASRLAGFFLMMQAIFIIVRKKNDPSKDIWEDLALVLEAGLIVFLFPELIKLAELFVNAISMRLDELGGNYILEAQKEFYKDGLDEMEESSTLGTWVQQIAISNMAGANLGSFSLANWVLKPLADFVNTLCFPTFMIIRAVSLNIVYWVAPLILILGAFPPFRPLWKNWFLIYIALLACGPALILANIFCEKCFQLYIGATNSPILGFIMIAMARFKAFQTVMDLCSKLFRS